MKPSCFLRLMLLVLGLLVVSLPVVRAQDKKPDPTAQSPDEKEKTLSDEARDAIAKDRANKGLDPLDTFLAERNARKERAKQEALVKAACQDLTDLRDMSDRIQNKVSLTEQDKQLIQDGPRFDQKVDRLSICANGLSGGERDEDMVVAANVRMERIEYLEWHVRGLAAKYNDLAANYNELVTNYNGLLAAAKRVILADSRPAPVHLRWFDLPLPAPTSPVRGSVVCTGDTIALGQGMTTFHVNCN